ncbi:MAG: gamma carbonic anhydrase family protein [Rubrobacteraceae bacterium]
MPDPRGTLLPYEDKFPQVPDSVFVAPGGYLIGDITLGEQSSVWYGAVLRGDTEPVSIGERTNIQDGSVLHADPGYPAVVGNDCVIGHRAVVHGCEIENGCLVGMGATILNGARIGEGSIVGAGALVPEGKEFPARSLIIGAPARRVREVTEEQASEIILGAKAYVERAAAHRASLDKS